jgi:hypothetical protein
MLENCLIVIKLYASAFLRGARFGFAALDTAVAAFFLEATRFNLALILFLLRLTPKEPVVRLPFLLFLSPLPMSFL